MTTTTGIARVRDAVAGTSTPRELVLSERVRVNGIVETCPNRPVSRNDDVIEVLRGEEGVPGSGGSGTASDAACWAEVAVATPRYFASYKPRGVVCSARRNEGVDREDSVLISDWLEGAVDGGGGGRDAVEEFRLGSMNTVGRLDEESEGLLLLTDDGSFARLLCDPEFGLGKTYRIVVRGSGYGGCVRGDAAKTTTDDDAAYRRRLAGVVSDMIHRGAASTTGTEPRFALESCRVVDAGRLPSQHPSDGSYYALADLVLREGRRHAVRRIVRNATAAGEEGGGVGGGTLRVCYLSRIAVEGLASWGAVRPGSLVEAQAMGFLPTIDGGGTKRRGEVPTAKLVPGGGDGDDRPMLLHPGHLVEMSVHDVDRIFSLRSLGYR
jgi:16S rRNA U516 pseudouridylate synthase RsuA-like enzyme